VKIRLSCDLFLNRWYAILSAVHSESPAQFFNPDMFNYFRLSTRLMVVLGQHIAEASTWGFLPPDHRHQDELIRLINSLSIEVDLFEDFFEAWNRSSQLEIQRSSKDVILFNKEYVPLLEEVHQLYSRLTGQGSPSSLIVELVAAIPSGRGKFVRYSHDVWVLVLPFFMDHDNEPAFRRQMLHEFAHGYTDKWINDTDMDVYQQRERMAEALVEQAYIQFCWPFESPYYTSDVQFHQPLRQIRFRHLGPMSTSFPRHSEAPYKVVPDLFFMGAQNEEAVFFSAALGRVWSIPKHFFKDDTLTINSLYQDHFINTGFLVNVGVSLPIQENKLNRFRFHMTERCNLSCTYCYLKGGSSASTLSKDIIDQTFRHMIETLPEQQKVDVEIEFHGGGEPTLAFDEMRLIAQKAKELLIEPRFRLQSNGVFSEEVLAWIIENSVSLSISIDGPAWIQNRQRPGADGSQSRTESNIRAILTQSYPLQTISIITPESLPYMDEIFNYLKALGVKAMMFNLSHALGRAHSATDEMAFIDAFLPLRLQAETEGIVLVSDFLADLTEGYTPRNFQCDACRPSTCVHYNGDLVACTRAYDILPPIENPFIWGCVRSDGLYVDTTKENALQSRTLENMPLICQRCFLKYNCAGDCLIALYQETGTWSEPIQRRCDAKRWFFVQYFLRLMRES